MKRVLEFDDAELDQFNPQVQEALFRMLRHQEEASVSAPRPRISDQKFPGTAEEEAKAAAQYRKDGNFSVPELMTGPKLPGSR